MDAVDSLRRGGHIPPDQALPEDRPSLRHLKAQVAKAFRQPLIRNDQLIKRYRKDVQEGRRNASLQVERILRLNAIRSESGIAIVTVTGFITNAAGGLESNTATVDPDEFSQHSYSCQATSRFTI